MSWKASAVRRVTTTTGASVAAILTLAGMMTAVASAQDQAKPKVDRQAVPQTDTRRKAAETERSQLDEERAKLTKRLLDTGRVIRDSEAKLSGIEDRLQELEAQKKIQEGAIAQGRDTLVHMLSAMQRIGRNPPPVIITRREDALQAVRSAMLLSRAVPELKTQADRLTEKLNDLDKVIREERKKQQELRIETSRLEDERLKKGALLEIRKQNPSENQQDLAELRKAAAEITQTETNLTDLIVSLDREVAGRTGLGRYEQETKQTVATAAVAPPPPAPQAGAKAKDTSSMTVASLPVPPAFELKPSGLGAGSNAGRLKPETPFHLAKAQLPMPAHGRRVLSFGEKTQYGSQSKGIVIETRHSAQVTAPADGWIVYAGEFRTYGQLLIINAGSGYHVLLAGLSQIDVQVGQFVLRSEPIGTMGAAPKGKSQDNAPVLYVEFRKEGRPIDPEPWWAEGSQKVQG